MGLGGGGRGVPVPDGPAGGPEPPALHPLRVSAAAPAGRLSVQGEAAGVAGLGRGQAQADRLLAP